MHAMTLATTCGHAWSAQCVIIVAPMSARHGYITADWSHPFADPDAAARQPSPAPKRRRLGRHSFRPATARSELAGNLETDPRGPAKQPAGGVARAGYSPSSSSYANPRSALKTSGLIEIPLACPGFGTTPILPLSSEAYQILWRRQNHRETTFSHSSRSAPGRAQRPAKNSSRASVIRSPTTGSVPTSANG
jgi:hypothetical protein